MHGVYEKEIYWLRSLDGKRVRVRRRYGYNRSRLNIPHWHKSAVFRHLIAVSSYRPHSLGLRWPLGLEFGQITTVNNLPPPHTHAVERRQDPAVSNTPCCLKASLCDPNISHTITLLQTSQLLEHRPIFTQPTWKDCGKCARLAWAI